MYLSDWPEKYPNCGKSKQSPKCTLDFSAEKELTKKINFVNYREPFGLIVENTGHGGESEKDSNNHE